MTSEYPFDLGRYHRQPSATSALAQRWFDRGLVWSYAFNHAEAIACCERALEDDPGFALAHWGVAYAVGPNYNKQWDAFDERDLAASLLRAHTEAHAAAQLAADGPVVERALTTALLARYPHPQPGPDLEQTNQAYADAMEAVYRDHPHDLDVCALYADALINVTAWQLWDLPTGEPATGAHTLRARHVLEAAMKLPGGDAHPGLLHFYLHLLEMSPRPEDARQAADRLRGLVPDAGHLLHMPTHIDVLLGDYRATIASNEVAVAADDRYAAVAGGENFYTLYRCHDHHFRIYGAMFAGRRATALAAADDLERALPESLLRVEVPAMADWLESFVGMRVHVLIRFGMWQQLIDAPAPADAALYAVTTALHHYGRGVALAATGRVAEAEAEQAALTDAVARIPDSRYLFNNRAVDLLAIAQAMLAGEIAYRAGTYETAWTHLRHAIELDDTLPYDEPWGWMQPTRHAYGALLLEQGDAEQAAAVYAADLGLDGTLPRACTHPLNVWSLRGYHQCLTRLGRDEEAAAIAPALARAVAEADVEIEVSCFCAMSGQP